MACGRHPPVAGEATGDLWGSRGLPRPLVIGVPGLPMPNKGAHFRFCAPVLHPVENLVRSDAGMKHESVVLDHSFLSWAAPFFTALI